MLGMELYHSNPVKCGYKPWVASVGMKIEGHSLRWKSWSPPLENVKLVLWQKSAKDLFQEKVDSPLRKKCLICFHKQNEQEIIFRKFDL